MADGELFGLCAAMMLSEAKKYHAYARECLKQAEQATRPDVRQRLIELSQVWMEAALTEEREGTASTGTATKTSR